MLKKISDSTVKLIKFEIIPKANINSDVNIDNIGDIFDLFWDHEIFLVQNLEDGLFVEPNYLKNICSAVDELSDIDIIDFKDLNERLNNL